MSIKRSIFNFLKGFIDARWRHEFFFGANNLELVLNAFFFVIHYVNRLYYFLGLTQNLFENIMQTSFNDFNDFLGVVKIKCEINWFD